VVHWKALIFFYPTLAQASHIAIMLTFNLPPSFPPSLQTHLGLDVNVTSAEVLRLNYEGNVFLKDGKVDQAIECYNNVRQW